VNLQVPYKMGFSRLFSDYYSGRPSSVFIKTAAFPKLVLFPPSVEQDTNGALRCWAPR
jgi:hypothetical protein